MNRIWKRTDKGDYVSNKGEIIHKYEKREAYRPVGQKLATRYHTVKYFYSHSINNGKTKFQTLKEIKAYFDKEV